MSSRLENSRILSVSHITLCVLIKSSLPDFFENSSVRSIETIFRHFSFVCDIHHIDFNEYGLIKVDVLLSVAYLIRIAAKRGLWGQSIN